VAAVTTLNEITRLIADSDIADVIRALTAAGAAAVPGILGEKARRHLLDEARTFPFIAAPAVVEPYGVRQRYAAVTSSRRAAASGRFGKPSRRS
jgi:hypothetical protein